MRKRLIGGCLRERVGALVPGRRCLTPRPSRRSPMRRWRGDRDAVKTLLKQGADVNAAQGDGMTALHWAARKGDAELAQMLLYAGANVKATTRLGGYTPLYLAGQSGNARDRGAARRPAPMPKAATTQRHHAADARGRVRQRRRDDAAARERRRRRTRRKRRAARRR